MFLAFQKFVHCEDPVSDYRWKEKITHSYAKPWAKYKEAFILSIIRKIDLKPKNVIRVKNVLRNLLLPSAHLRNRLSKWTKYEKVETLLLFKLSLRRPKFLPGPVTTFVPSTSWILTLHVGIHSVVAFSYLLIYGIVDICTSNVQVMHYLKNPQFIFTFCSLLKF